MLVQKHALPAGTRYLGMLDTITGEFTGDVEKFSPFADKIKEQFVGPQTFAESLNFSLPYHVLAPPFITTPNILGPSFKVLTCLPQ